MDMIQADANFEVTLNGTERYPVQEGGIQACLSHRIQKAFKGLPRYAGCVEKNKIANEILGGAFTQVVGALAVMGDSQPRGIYRFEYNPPLELHSWLTRNGWIIDFSLPGVIERGLKIIDEYGPILKGREPIIACGKPFDWTIYQAYEVLT